MVWSQQGAKLVGTGGSQFSQQGQSVACGAVLQTLTGNGLNFPFAAAFNGERVLITNQGDSVSLWKAADLTTSGSFATDASSVPFGACSDGVNFWITLSNASKVARF